MTDDIRTLQNCFPIFSISCSLLLMLCVVAGLDEVYDDGLNMDEQYGDVDNIEWHHVKVVDGIMHEDHPVVMYKEDFVSEDFKPLKLNKSLSSAESSLSQKHKKHKYRDIAKYRRNRLNNNTKEYNIVKPEKVYFDVLPQTPIISEKDGDKFDVSAIQVEELPLPTETNDEESKAILNKSPKKYHRRQRRDTTHRLKRNPYLRHESAQNVVDHYLKDFLETIQRQQLEQQGIHSKTSVPGKLWNSLNLDVPPSFENRFGDEYNTERVVWGRNTARRPASTTARPATNTRRPPPPLFRDPNPENADTSMFNRFPISNPTVRPTSRPTSVTRRPPPPLFRDPNPENADTSIFNNLPEGGASRRPTERPSNTPAQSNPISLCALAIVSCCSTNDQNIRYNCFEQNGCNGAFWNLNPCADNVRDNVINYLID